MKLKQPSKPNQPLSWWQTMTAVAVGVLVGGAWFAGLWALLLWLLNTEAH